jgi:ATP-dependent RNA helicase DeaD
MEKIANATFHRLDIPSASDVCRKQFFTFMDTLMQADISHGDYETYLPDLEKKFRDITKEDVLKRVAALQFNQLLKYYENAEDLNPSLTKQNNRGDKSSHRTGGGTSGGSGDVNGYTRMFVNIGTKDGFYKASFLQFVLDESKLKKEVLGRIDMRELQTWFEIDSAHVAKMVKTFNGRKFKSRTIRMNPADEGKVRHGHGERNYGAKRSTRKKGD